VTVRYLGYKAERRRRYNSQPAPVFTQDFTTGGGGALPPGSTFSRGTIGTLYNSQGLVAYAPSNLFLQSNFATGWSFSASASFVGTGIAPDGTNTAQLFNDATAASSTYCYQSVNWVSGTTYTISVYLLPLIATAVSIKSFLQAGEAIFTVAGGVISNSSVTGICTAQSATAVGSGWYRLTATMTANATGANNIGFLDYNAVDTGNVFYIWGAQLEQSPTPTTYTPTTTAAVYGPRFDYDPGNVLQQNWLSYSQQFNNAAWNKAYTTVYPNTLQAPDGTYTASTITNTVGQNSYIVQATPVSVPVGTAYVMSVYLQQLVGNGLLYLENIGAGGISPVTINLLAGTISTGTLTPVGNGWYLASWPTTTNASSPNPHFVMYMNFYGVSTSAQSVGVWGAQVSVSSAQLPYLPTTSTPQTVCAPKGLLIEESRTNLLTYSNTFTNAAWNQATNIVVSTATISSPDGTANAYTLTDNATNAAHCIFGTGASITAGTAYTISVYANAGTLRYVSLRGEQTSVASNYPWITVDLQTGAINSNGLATSSSATPVGNGWYRITLTFTALSTIVGNLVIAASNVSTAPIVTNTLGNAYAGTTQTLYVYGAQLEAGAFATSYIPTTSAAVGRGADVLSQPISSIPYFSATAGTFAITYSLDEGANSGSPAAFTIGPSGTSSGFNTSGGGAAQWWNGSTNIITTNGSTNWTVPRKEAFAYTASSRALCQNAGTVATDANVPWGTLGTTFDWGSGYGTSQWINGHIRSFSYFNYALTNTQLQQVTT